MSDNKNTQGTLIHGIAASQAMDSSGERIIIEGIDISSLTEGNGGVFNFEHQSKEASSIVGKITEAKKILKESDCETEAHRYFWDKVKMPYLYVAGELFDFDGHQSAKDVAAMLKYDSRNKGTKVKKLINFSIEGQRLDKKGQEIKKCVARKVSITITPCNHTAVAEELKPPSAEELNIKEITNKEKINKFGQHEQNFSMIQDLMSKNEEQFASVEPITKTTNADLSGVPTAIKAESFTPKRTFTPQSAPSTMRVGDRISYKQQPKPKTGAEIYGKPPSEKKFGQINADNAISKNKDKKKIKKEHDKEEKIEKREFFRRIGNRYNDMMQRMAADKTAKKVQLGRESQGLEFSPDSTVVANKNKVTLGSGRPRQEEPRDTYQPQSRPRFFYHEPEPYRAPDISEERAAKNREAIDRTIMASQNKKEDERARQRAIETGSADQGTVKLGKYDSNVRKALTAGSGMGAPSTLSQGAALQGEEMDKTIATAFSNDSIVTPSKAGSFKKNKKKKEVLKSLSNEAFDNFTKKEELIDFLIKKLPNNSAEEIMAIAKAVAYTSIKKQEIKLEELMKSKNVREQRARVFGTKSQPTKKSPMREKHMEHIANFAQKFLGLKMNPSGGKMDMKTGERRDKNADIGIDKPDWRSGQFETQWNPEAAVHEIAHLMLLPPGVGLEEGQQLMDKQYGDIQSKYGYMKQKRSQGEVQPMAAEQPIRRRMGLPASQVSVPVKEGEGPRTSVEDPNVVIGTRVQRGKTKEGQPKMVDLIRQSRNLTPENRDMLERRLSGQEKFHPEHGWQPSESVDSKITRKG